MAADSRDPYKWRQMQIDLDHKRDAIFQEAANQGSMFNSLAVGTKDGLMARKKSRKR